MTFGGCLNHYPFDVETNEWRGFNFGVGSTTRSSWQFSRCPFTEVTGTCRFPNVFSLAPYVDDYNGERSPLVFLYYSGNNNVVYYSSYNFASGVVPSAWSTPITLAQAPSLESYRSPQITSYRDSSGNGYLMLVWSHNWLNNDPPYYTAYKSRVEMGIWDLDNPGGSPIVEPFPVTVNESYHGASEYYFQEVPSVCVEKTASGEADFDIHVCWTNTLGFVNYDPPCLRPADVNYRSFHFDPE